MHHKFVPAIIVSVILLYLFFRGLNFDNFELSSLKLDVFHIVLVCFLAMSIKLNEKSKIKKLIKYSAYISLIAAYLLPSILNLHYPYSGMLLSIIMNFVYFPLLVLNFIIDKIRGCLLYTSPSPRD